MNLKIVLDILNFIPNRSVVIDWVCLKKTNTRKTLNTKTSIYLKYGKPAKYNACIKSHSFAYL